MTPTNYLKIRNFFPQYKLETSPPEAINLLGLAGQ